MSWLCGRRLSLMRSTVRSLAGVGHWPAESRDAETVLQNVCYLRPLGLNKSNMYSSTQIRRCVGRYCDDDVIISRPTAFGATQSWKSILATTAKFGLSACVESSGCRPTPAPSKTTFFWVAIYLPLRACEDLTSTWVLVLASFSSDIARKLQNFSTQELHGK